MPACPHNSRFLHDTADSAPLTLKTGSFSRSKRLLRSADYQRAFANGRKLNSRHLIVLVVENELEHPRLGLAISRKHVKTAVVRNRIKRQLRESFRQHQNNIGNIDVVILAKAGLSKLSKQQLRLQLIKHWQELSKRCKES